MMLVSLSTYYAGMPQIVIAGPAGRDDTRALLDAARSKYRPGAVIVPVPPERRTAIAQLLPWIESMEMREGRATAYVCRDFVCSAPTSDPSALAAAL